MRLLINTTEGIGFFSHGKSTAKHQKVKRQQDKSDIEYFS
jgi:hypothetical protein